MTKLMQAVELRAPGTFHIREDYPIPEPGPGEIRVRVEAAGICGTDVHICSGHPSMNAIVRPPVVLGHEFCGIVDALGPATGDSQAKGILPGDFVSAEMHEVCHTCPACRDGAFHACARTKIHGVHLDGAFADYVVVSAGNVISLPEDLPRSVGAILDPLGNAVHTACKVPLADRSCSVIGYGPIGAMCAEVALFIGARHLFVLDVKDQALERARSWQTRRGLADRVTILDAREPGTLAKAIEASEGGVDVAMEISGHPDGINNAIAMTRAAGHVVQLGLPRAETVEIRGFSTNIVFKGLTIHAIIGRQMFATWEKMLELLRDGLDVSHLVTAEIPLCAFADGLQRFADGSEGKVVLYPRGLPGAR